MTHRPTATALEAPAAADPALRSGTPIDAGHAEFLRARLTEEIDAALARRSLDGATYDGGRSPRRRTTRDASEIDRGLATMLELRASLEQGRTPDQMSLDLLTVAYARHPEFRESWNRWRRS